MTEKLKKTHLSQFSFKEPDFDNIVCACKNTCNGFEYHDIVFFFSFLFFSVSAVPTCMSIALSLSLCRHFQSLSLPLGPPCSAVLFDYVQAVAA